MLINKNRYQISKDRKLMHKVGKQWVVVSAFVLALLGAKGAKTMIHASSTQTPDQQVTNQINQHLQKDQKLINQQQNTQSSTTPNIQNGSQDTQHNNVQGTAQSTAGTNMNDRNIMQAAKNLHARVITHNIMSIDTDQARRLNPSSNQITNKKPLQNNQVTTETSGSSNTRTSASSLSKSKSMSSSMTVRDSSNSESNSYQLMAKASQNSVSNAKYSEANQSIKRNLGQLSHNIGVTDDVKTGTYDGLNYKYDTTTQSLEFTGGTVNVSNVSHFIDNSDFGGTLDYGYNNPYFNTNLKHVTFDNGVNFSKVSDMSDMFEGASSLQTITLPDTFNTSNVTNMSNMFSSDSSLQTIVLPDSFNTSNVTNMSGMFSYDSSLYNLVLPSSFDTSHVTNMSNMFSVMYGGSIPLKSLIVKSSKTKFNSSANVPALYSQVSGLNYVNYDSSKGRVGTFTSNIPSGAYVYGTYDGLNYKYNPDDKSLEFISGTINVSNTKNFLIQKEFGEQPSDMGTMQSTIKAVKFDSDVDASHVTNMSDMFSNSPDLRTATLQFKNPVHVTSMSNMFYADNSLQSATLSFDPTNVTNMNNMFCSDSSLNSITFASDFNTSNVRTMDSMFEQDTSLQSITFPSSFDTSHVTSMDHLFEIDDKLNTITIKSPKTRFYGTVSDVPLTYYKTKDNEYVLNTLSSGNVGTFTTKLPKIFTGNYDGLNFRYNTKTQSLEFLSGTINVSDTNKFLNSNIFGMNPYDSMGENDPHNSDVVSVKFDSDVNTSHVTNMSGMFSSDTSLQTLILPNNFSTDHVTDMSNMFNGDTSLQTLTLPSNFNTSHVTNMSGMFKGDSTLQTLTLPSNLNTSHVTDMDNMFSGDYDLQSLTLSNLDTSHVTNMSDMFENSGLKSLTLPDTFDTSHVTNMSDMFGDDSLQSLTVKSPKTKLSTDSGLNTLYVKVNGLEYKPNNFAKGNVGTFILPSNNGFVSGTYKGLDYKYFPRTSSLEFIDGDIKWNSTKGNSFISDPSDIVGNNGIDSIKFDNNVRLDDRSTDLSNMFSNLQSLSSLDFGTGFNTSHVTKSTNMIYNYYGTPLNKLIIRSPETKFANNSGLPIMYQQIENNYNNTGDPLCKVTDFSNGMTGSFSTNEPNNAILQGTYDGLTYIYANNNLEFTSGTLTWNGNNSRPFIGETPDMETTMAPAGTNTGYSVNINSIKIDSDVNLNHVTNMSYMFNDAPARSVILPNDFSLNHVSDINHMFHYDSNLTSLTLPESFNTSHVTNMSDMFTSDISLTSLTLPKSFDTSHVTNMNYMFFDNNIQRLTIQSPNTKFNHTASVPNLYAKVNESKYSLNDFSKGNVGTFLSLSELPNNAYTDDGNYRGMNYRYYPKSNVTEFINGTANSDLSHCLYYAPSDIKNSAWIKFDSDVDLSHVTTMSDMNYSDEEYDGSNKVSIDFPSNFNTTGIDMNGIFSCIGDEVIIRSPKTSLDDGTPGGQYSDYFYKKDTNDGYTTHLITSLNYRSNCVGAWLRNENLNPNSEYEKAPIEQYYGLSYKYFKNSDPSSDIKANSVEFLSGSFNQFNGVIGNPRFLSDSSTPSDVKKASRITFDQGINTSQLHSMGNFFDDDPNIEYLDISNLDINPDFNMETMWGTFQGDTKLKQINLGNSFNTQGVTFLQSMFADDPSLQSINLPASFNTTTAYNYKDGTGLIGIFASDPNLREITINSSDTQIPNINNGNYHYGQLGLADPVLYSKDIGDNYTSPNPAENFYRGTYAAKNIPTETINYVYKNKIVGTQKLSDSGLYNGNGYSLGNTIDINNDYAQEPSGYQLVNSDNYITQDAGTHAINVIPLKATDVIDYQYNGNVIASDSLTGNSISDKGVSDTTLTINNKYEPNIPKYYHLKDTNDTFNYDNQKHVVNILPNQATDTVHYIYKGKLVATGMFTGNDVRAQGADNTSFKINNDDVAKVIAGYHLTGVTKAFNYDGGTYRISVAPNFGNATVRYLTSDGNMIPASDDNGGVGTISGIENSTINPVSQFPVPNGYHLINDNQKYHFGVINVNNPSDNPSDVIKVQGNPIKGTAKVRLIYKENDGKHNVLKSTRMIQIPINGHVGDVIRIDPLKYAQNNYNSSTSDWTIPMDYTVALNGSNLNYIPQHTFTYTSTKAVADITYVDVGNGAQLVPNVKDTATGSDYHQDDNQTVSYQGHKYPIIGHQNLSDVGLVGQTVDFSAKGTDVGTNDMVAPKGFHFINNNSNDRILMHHVKLEPNMHLTMLLGLNRPKMLLQDTQNKPEIVKTGVYDGLNYIYYNNPNEWNDTTVEFTGGKLDIPKGSVFITPKAPSDIFNAQTIMFDNDIDLNQNDPNTSNNNIAQEFITSDNNLENIYMGTCFSDFDFYNRPGDNEGMFDSDSNFTSASANIYIASPNIQLTSSDFQYYSMTFPAIGINVNDPQQHIMYYPPYTDTFNYTFRGQVVFSRKITGPYGCPKYVVKANANLPSGYSLVNPFTKFSFDGKTHTIPIIGPSTDTINYVLNNKVIGSQQFIGKGQTPFDVNKSNAKLPTYYSLVNADNKFKYDSDVHNVPVYGPSIDTINYTIGNKVLMSQKLEGTRGSTFNINSTDVPLSYRYALVNSNNNFTYDNKVHNIPMTMLKTDLINYVCNGQVIYRQNLTGKDGNTFDVTSSNAYLPAGYTLVNKDNAITYNGQNHNIAVNQKASDTVAFESASDNSIEGTPFTINGVVGQKHTVAANQVPQGYKLASDGSQNITLNNGNHFVHVIADDTNPTSDNSDVPAVGNQETVPVEFIDQNGNRVGSVDTSRQGDVDTIVGLPTSAPHGYTMNANQPTRYLISSSDIDASNQNRVYPIVLHVTANHVNVNVQYMLTNGTKVGNVVTIPNQQVGTTVDLTRLGLPQNEMLAPDHGDPKHYQLSVTDLAAPSYNQTKALPVYVTPMVQSLTINYVDQAHDKFLDSRTVPSIDNGSEVYLANDNVVDRNSGNFIDHDNNLMGYQAASGQNLSPTVQMQADGDYPTYTVNMQSQPAILHVTYYDFENGNKVGSDEITQNNQGQPASIGDVISLPTVGHSNGLDTGYTLNSDQLTSYQLNGADIVKNQHAVKNISMLAHGDSITAKAPVTVDVLDGSQIQRSYVINEPIYGNVGDNITFDSSDFQAYLPKNYVLVNANNGYNHTDYTHQKYTANLTPSDMSNGWQADSWQIAHNGNYWDQQHQRPLIVIQVATGKQITVHFVDQNHDQVGATALIGDYRNRVDLNDPSRDGKSALNGKLPNGYTYSNDNPAAAVYGRNPRTIDLNVVGQPETVKTEYDNQNGQPLSGSTDDVVDGHRMGDLITLSTAHLPTGYHVTNPQALTYRINPTDDPQRTGTIVRHVAVAGNAEVLPVKFVDQNGAQVGDVNYQTKGVIGQTNVALPTAPVGYHYDTKKDNNGNTYDFDSNQIDPSQTNSMKQHVVYLQGDTESVPVNFVDQNGKLVSRVPESGQIGNVITLPNAPQNYSENQGQSNQYRLSVNNINTPGHMRPVTIHVWTNQKYQFNVTADENINGALISKVTTPVDVSGPSGTNDLIKPEDHVPAGFRSVKTNQPVSTTVTDSGLSKAGITWQYDATNSRGNQNPNDHLTAQPIYVTYRDANTGQALKNYNNIRLDGYMDTQVDVTNAHNGGVAIPQGYVLNPDQNILYQITTAPQHVTLNVHGVVAGNNEFQLQIAKEYYRNSVDAAKGTLTTLMTPQSVTENGNVDSQFKVEPNNYVPAGYQLDDKHDQNNQAVTGTVKVNGLDPNQHTFYYVASLIGQNGVQPIKVTYYDDQTGAKEGTNVITDGHMDQTYTVSQLGTNGLAKGYRVDSDQNQIYTVGTQPIAAHVMVHGNAAVAKHNVVTVQIYKEDPYGNVFSDQPSTVQDVINGSTGKQYTVSAEDYVPSDYQMDTRKNGDHDLTGVINPDGSISKNNVKFYYQMSSQAEDNLKPIHVMYENDADQNVIADEVITPSEAHDDYNGKFVDVVPTKSNSNSDNQQAPVPQGYVVDSQQDTRAGFSNVQPTYIDVLVHNDSNTQYHDRFDQIENFYDGNQLVRTSDVPQTVKGVDGQSFTINAPQSPVGYTVADGNPVKVTGYINGHQLTVDNANYRFNATNSTGYDHPSDHDHAQPILVTFKDGTATIGQSDQRVDGYMDQTVNVLSRLVLPSGYQTAGGDQLNYQITNHVQRPMIQIVPETAQNAVVNYEDQDSNHVVAQRAVTVPVGTKLTSLSDEYTTFVPYGYAYAGHNNWDNRTQVTNNGQYVVYVTKLDDRARPLSRDASDNGMIKVDYQDQNGHLISTYTLKQAKGTTFKASDYTKARAQNGQMPDNFTDPQIISGEQITKFDPAHSQRLTIKVNTLQSLATAKVEYEDAKTHQLITNGTRTPLSLTVSGHAGDTLNYDDYQRFVPQGYAYYGMGDHDSVIEDGDVDIVMVRKAKLNNNHVGQINVTYHNESTGSDVDTVSVSGLVGRPFDLDYYEQDLPLGGYEFTGASQNALSFASNPQNVTINLRKPKPVSTSHYGKIVVYFVKADSKDVSPNVNGNQSTSDTLLSKIKVPSSIDEVMTGHIGDLFTPEMYEHNTPQGTSFDHIVKGNNISTITGQPQEIWIAVQAMNGQF